MVLKKQSYINEIVFEDFYLDPIYSLYLNEKLYKVMEDYER